MRKCLLLHNTGAILTSAALVIAAASCSTGDEHIANHETETPITASVQLPIGARGALSRAFHIDSKLSKLALHYTDSKDATKSVDIVDDKIIQTSANSPFSFSTGNNLCWQDIQGEGDTDTRFFLIVDKADDGALWASKAYSAPVDKNDPTYRGALDFGTMHYRLPKFSLKLTFNQDIDLSKLNATIQISKPEEVEKNDHARLPIYISDNVGSSQFFIIKATESSSMLANGTVHTATALIPACQTLGGNKTLTITYNGISYTFDLSSLKLMRAADSPFVEGKYPYNIDRPNTKISDATYANIEADYFGTQRFNDANNAFSYNPGEHISLNLKVNLATGISLSSVEIADFLDGGNVDLPAKP